MVYHYTLLYAIIFDYVTIMPVIAIIAIICIYLHYDILYQLLLIDFL